MKNRLKYIFVFVLMFSAICCLSCKRKKLYSKEHLISYLEKNKDLSQTRIVNDVRVQVRFCPYQLMVQQEIDGELSIDSLKLAELREKYSHQYYFRLSFSKNNKQLIRQLDDASGYSEMLQIFAFKLGSYINATNDLSDTLSLSTYAFMQDYGMSNSNTVLLVFNKADFEQSKEVIVNVGEFGLGIGALQFYFNKSDMEDIPEISYTVKN